MREVVEPISGGLLPGGNSCYGSENPFIPCFRCGMCCIKYQVHLSLVEAKRIAHELGVGWQEFQDKYLDRRWPGAQSFLLRHHGGGCVFLKHDSGNRKTSCLIHPFRPSSCQEWTPSLYRRECQAGLTKLWWLTVSASGQLEGSEEKVREFYSLLESLK